MGFRAREPFEVGQVDTNIELDRFEQARAQFQLTARDTFLGHAVKQVRRFQARQEDSPLIEPDQANAMAPNLPEKISEPIKLSVLQDIIAEDELRRTLQMQIAHGPNDILAGASSLVMGLSAHMFDPFEFLAGGFASMGVGALGRAMMAGRFTKSASAIKMGKALASGDKATYARLATEGLIGNAAVEPFLIAGTLDDHQDANIYNSFVSVVGGSLGFAALIRGAAEIPTLAAKFGEDAVGAYMRVSTGQTMYGKKPRTDKLTKHIVEEAHNGGPSPKVRETKIKSKSGQREIDIEHQSKDMTPTSVQDASLAGVASKVKHTRWFIPHKLRTGVIDRLNSINPGRVLGKGITLTDNPVTANGYSSHSTLKTPGMIYEVQPKVNLITQMDVDTIKPRSDSRQRAVTMLTELGLNKTEIQKVLKNSPTHMEALDRLIGLMRAGKLKGVQGTKLLDLQGWYMEKIVPGEAALYKNTKTAGVDHNPQNLLYIKESTIKKMGKKKREPFEKLDEYEPNPEFNKVPSRDELEGIANDYTNPETDRYFNKEAADEYRELSLNPAEDPLVAELNEITDTHKETLKAMKEAGELDADEVNLLDDLDEMTAVHEKELEIAKDGFNCQIGL